MDAAFWAKIIGARCIPRDPFVNAGSLNYREARKRLGLAPRAVGAQS
jgi:hypothetical protein